MVSSPDSASAQYSRADSPPFCHADVVPWRGERARPGTDVIATNESYRHLRARAADLLGAAGGTMEAAALAAELFGAAGRTMSGPLLDAVLADDPRFRREPTAWSLAVTSAPSHAAENTVLALALATTGADPKRHRIVRLAAVRASAAGIVGRLDLVLSPGRRLARYLVDGARLSEDEVREASAFAEVVSDLREFFGDDDLYVYGAAWTRSFLDLECIRADELGLANRIVEIDVLGAGVVAEGRKPGLASLAAALGLVHARPGVPPADAEIAARVVLALREREPTAITEAPPTAPARPLLDRSWLASVPSCPGVYLMHDDVGRVLYVGKAVDLRRRLGVYLGRAPGLHRRLEALPARAASVGVRPTASDFEATLLEARLLAEHAPSFNVSRRTHRPAAYIRLAPSDDPPRVRLVREPAADGASYVGPLKSARAAQQAVAVARAAFPDAFLRRLVNAERQRASVLEVARLLGGQKDGALAALRATMAACAAAGDRAGIDRARAALAAVRALTVEASALIGLGERTAVLILERVGEWEGRAHLVRDGRHAGSADVDLSTWQPDPASRRALEVDITPVDNRELPDEQTIIARWLAQSRAVLGVYSVPD
jgi:DNA polymerase III epsilon subunit-like protein